MVLTSSLLDLFLALAYPQRCAICDASVEKRELGNCCQSCWLATRIFTERDRLCSKCGVALIKPPIESVLINAHCHRCDSHPFATARAIGLYSGALRETVLHLKQEPHLPRIVIEQLVGTLDRLELEPNTIIVPVPLHPIRLRTRGFNQAAVIANTVSRISGFPIASEVLIRTAESEKYRAGLDAKGRHDTVAKAFAVVHARVITGEYALLVDDVFTTGATVSACAEVLLAAGAKGVNVLTIARSRV
jgi:ComF family protein